MRYKSINRNWRYIMIKIYSRFITIILTLLFVAACETVPEPEPVVVEQAPAKVTKPVIVRPSANPIVNPSKSDVLFAQSSLKALGYAIGSVDGIWGKRSSAAMIAFEKKQNIQSANGQLSPLNLATLKNNNTATVIPAPSTSTKKTISGIASKLSSATPNPQAPELIIVDQDYSILLKANPYSEVVTNIKPGAAIYILSLQAGWYEVETLSNQRGFIQVK